MLQRVARVKYALDERLGIWLVAFEQCLHIFGAGEVLVATTKELAGNHKRDFASVELLQKGRSCTCYYKAAGKHRFSLQTAYRTLCPGAGALDQGNAREILFADMGGGVAKIKSFWRQPTDFTHYL